MQHRNKSEELNNFYFSFSRYCVYYGNFTLSDEPIFIVLWHGDEDIELTEVPQLHKHSELKVLNTEVAFA